MDRRFIRRYCVLFFFSATRLTLLENGPSVNLMVPIQFVLLCSVPSTLMLASTVSSVHPTVLFLFPFLSRLACGILASLGPRNVYKDMLNNTVSPIYHVVMNHQNHTRTNGI
jgi:hypothetical protein